MLNIKPFQIFLIGIFLIGISIYILSGIFLMYELVRKNEILKKLLCNLILRHNLTNDKKIEIPNFLNKSYDKLLHNIDKKLER